MPETGKGSCLCGAVSFKTFAALRPIRACHCSQCRKQSGHFWAATDVGDDQISIQGADNLTWYVSSPGHRRGFCKTCGSPMFWQKTGKARIAISAGSLESPTNLKLSAHIYCADKGDYYEIVDDIPQLERGGGVSFSET